MTRIGRLFDNPLARNFSLLTASQYGGAVLAVLSNVLAATALGPTRYGMAAVALSFPTLVWAFAGTKSIAIVTRYVSAFRATDRIDELKAIVKVGYAVDALMSLVVIALVFIGIKVFPLDILRQGEVAWLALAYAASFPFLSLTGTSWAVLSSLGRFRVIATLRLSEKLVSLLLVLLTISQNWGVRGFVLAMAISQVLAGMTMAIGSTSALSSSGIRSFWKVSIAILAPLKGELKAFVGWNYIVSTMGGLVSQLPVLVLGEIRGPAEAGYFRIAASAISTATYAEASLARVTYPLLSADWATGATEGIRKKLVGWTLKAGLPLASLLMLTIPFLDLAIRLTLGQTYSPIVPGLRPMVLGAAFSVAFFYLGTLFYAIGSIRAWAAMYAIYVILVLMLIIPGSRTWGFTGVGYVIGIGNAAFNTVVAGLVLIGGKFIKTGQKQIST